MGLKCLKLGARITQGGQGNNIDRGDQRGVVAIKPIEKVALEFIIIHLLSSGS
jgi:hypothetical protein